MAPARPEPDNGVVEPNAASRGAVYDDIRALIDHPSPYLDDVERTLTDGYAHAMALEGERLRLQRRLGDAAHALGGRGRRQELDELSSLGARLVEADRALAELRAILASLRARAQQLRAA